MLIDKFYINGTNFWTDVFPMLHSSNKDKRIYVVAGDVGGGPDTISAYFARANNVTFLATGMGETIDENFMEITITGDDKPIINLVPLNSWIKRIMMVMDRMANSFIRLLRKTIWQLTKVNVNEIEDY